jgi:hypothetical protein
LYADTAHPISHRQSDANDHQKNQSHVGRTLYLCTVIQS